MSERRRSPVHTVPDRPPPVYAPELLKGQKALVTGGNSGIGKATAIALGRSGADVVVNYVSDRPGAEAVVKEIEGFGVRTYAHQADVSQEDQVIDMVSAMIDRLGTIDIMVANAGLQRDAPTVEMTLKDWNKVIEVNLTGQFLCAREAIKEFQRRGVVPEVSRAAGKVICMSSVHQMIPWAGHVNYAASKGGVAMLMETLAQEFAPQRIRVNAIAPGAIRTPINRPAWETPEAREKLLELIPYGRIGDPQDIANAAVVLASDLCDYVVGTTFYVDGGMTLFPGFATGG
ncbi:SDR family oxidoreductase [Streptomyces sp. NPDC005322]|uniref:SDR family oxidoreductase n=1 Tax=Streptomyces sp. NPDC005322 TaxID=3157032 RepID=UPI0033A0DC7F